MFPLTVGPVSAVSCSIEIVKKITLLRPTVSKGGDIKWKGVRIFLGVRARALVYEAFLFIPPPFVYSYNYPENNTPLVRVSHSFNP